jgi:hypothetical protein
LQGKILTERWIWLIGSLCIAIVASWIKWGFRRTGGVSYKENNDSPWGYHVLRLAYAVGIPTIALLWRGALTTKGLGLQLLPWNATSASNAPPLTDWAFDIGWAICIMSLAGIIIAISERRIEYQGHTAISLQHPPLAALREALYHQVHWAFYREPFVLVWSINLGTWAGLLPVIIEALANPEHWTQPKSLSRYRNLLLRAALAVVSALMYLKTQNLWLAIMVDAGLGWGLGQYDPDAVIPKSRQWLKQSVKST